MFGGRQFFMGLLLGGLGLAFAQTREGRQLLDRLAQTFVLNKDTTKTVTAVPATGEDKDIRHDARESDENS